MTPQENLNYLRNLIESIDEDIVELLNARASLMGDIVRVKEQLGVPIYCPEREAAVIDTAKKRSRNLSSEAITTIYAAIFTTMRSLQERAKRPESEQWEVEKTPTAAILRTASGKVLLALKPDEAGQLERLAERHEQERR